MLYLDCTDLDMWKAAGSFTLMSCKMKVPKKRLGENWAWRRAIQAEFISQGDFQDQMCIIFCISGTQKPSKTCHIQSGSCFIQEEHKQYSLLKTFKRDSKTRFEKLLFCTKACKQFKSILLLHGRGCHTVRAYYELSCLVKSVLPAERLSPYSIIQKRQWPAQKHQLFVKWNFKQLPCKRPTSTPISSRCLQSQLKCHKF